MLPAVWPQCHGVLMLFLVLLSVGRVDGLKELAGEKEAWSAGCSRAEGWLDLK